VVVFLAPTDPSGYAVNRELPAAAPTATANIVINPAGLGVMGDGGSVQSVTIVATQ
jgi:hypothetical protein